MAGATPEETDRLVEEAISEGNVDALLELFEPTAVFVDPGTGNVLRGHDEIRTAVIEMFKSKPTLESKASPTVWISGDIALVLSRWSMRLVGADGDALAQSGTATDVMRRQGDGTWRYVIDNPAGIEVVG